MSEKLLFETAEDVQAILMKMADVEIPDQKEDDLRTREVQLLEGSEDLLTSIFKSAVPVRANDFLFLGNLYTRLLHTDLAEFCHFLVKKHREYGADPLMISRVQGIVDRMLHKLARIKNLRRGEADLTEHIQAELQDLLGYSVVAYLFIQRYGA
jgi:hypothetical protein